jgi:SAM-dependent methyltransferase
MLKSTKSDKHRRIHGHYTPLVRPGATHHEMLDWSSREAQHARFEVLAESIRRHKLLDGCRVPSLLDVGCGITDVQTFLEAHNMPCAYTGVDITPPILEHARRKHPERALVLADVFVAPPFAPGTFDIVFCSGTLNLRLGNNEVFAGKAIAAMLGLAKRMVVANFLHERAARRYGQCFYYSPSRIRNQAEAVLPPTAKTTVIDDYLDNDFTLEIKL